MLEPDDPSYRALCAALNDAAATAHEQARQRLDGDLVSTPPMPEAPRRRKAPSATRTSGLTLLELFERFAAVPGRNPKTVAQCWPYIAHFTKFVDGKLAD